MEKFKLKLEARNIKSPNATRRAGWVPATIYGPAIESESVQIDAKEFSRLPHAAYSHIIELVSAEGKPVSAIIRNVQRRATTQQVLNIEFYRVSSDRKLTVQVPLKFIGTSPAVGLGGLIQENYQEAEIECFPADIPDFIEVEMSLIEQLDHGIHFSELTVSNKIKILNPADEIVVRVVTPRAVPTPEEEAKAAAAAAPAAAAPAAKEGEGAKPAAAAAK
ncbi:MAG: 50S ribosomal protein L25 [Candidatus Obscuribacterales bacterium]|nr:50S ribosomal protein L25 [Candidatus Obscuribacterales bacterium]